MWLYLLWSNRYVFGAILFAFGVIVYRTGCS